MKIIFPTYICHSALWVADQFPIMLKNYCFFLLLSLLMLRCAPESVEQTARAEPLVRWGLHANHFTDSGQAYEAFFILDNRSDSFKGDWALHFNAFLGSIESLAEGYEIKHLKGEYWQLSPKAGVAVPRAGQIDSIPYRATGAILKAGMAPRGFFLVQGGQAKPVSWQQLPMTKAAVFGSHPMTSTRLYDDAASLYARYAAEPPPMVLRHPVSPAPASANLQEKGMALVDMKAAKPSLHLWCRDARWEDGVAVFGEWLSGFYQTQLVQHAEEKPQQPHVTLAYDQAIPEEGYRILYKEPLETVVSASSRAGMLYGLATVLQSLRQEGDSLVLPLAEVVDAPRFAYRGQMLDVGRNFQSKEAVMQLLDLMALFKLNTFHFHLTDDEGWRLAIPGLAALTELGARRGYTLDEHDHLQPAYGSGPFVDRSAGSCYYSREDYIAILRYARARSIEVIPEIDLPGHARAAIKAMEAYARQTGDEQYALSEASDESRYNSIQDYPDNTIAVCQPSTYRFLEKVVDEIQQMHEVADLPLRYLHIGGDEVANGVWLGSPACKAWLAAKGQANVEPDEIKNLLSDHFRNNFKAILDKRGIRTAGWEEIAMERKPDEKGQYRYVVDTKRNKEDLLPYVWNSLGKNVTLAYELANAGYEVVICNVNNFYFDMAYTNDPSEPGFMWGGFVDTYRSWAFAPYDAVRTMPPLWYAPSPSEGEMRQLTTPLHEKAKGNIKGLQGQLWSETVTQDEQIDYYLFPKLLGLAERAWSGAAVWESLEDPIEREAAMAADWANFAARLGHHSLPLLDRYQGEKGVGYRLAPPGAIIEQGQLLARSEFPGSPIYYQLNGGAERLYEEPLPVVAGDQIQLRVGRSLGADWSKATVVTVSN